MLKDDEDEEYDDDKLLISILFINLQLSEEGYSDKDYIN